MNIRFPVLAVGVLMTTAAIPESSAFADSATIPTASERVAASPAVPMGAALFALDKVRLLPSPFQQAQETDRTYLLSLDTDRLLSHLRRNVGLIPKAPSYGGWDTGGASTIGHYLSACAQMTQATGDPILKQRVDYIVSEMAACQKAGGDGGLCAYPWDKNTYFPSLAAGKVIPMNTSPWYLTHKIMAGLRDAYLLCGSMQAREVLVKMCDWENAVTASLTPAKWQEMLGPPNKMGEFGGPHEVIADVYAITGDKKYLTLAEKFRHSLTFDPLERGDGSVLSGHHANSEIPKFIGYERIYELTGDPTWHRAAWNFWDNVAKERTWANGGIGQSEHFFDPAENGSQVDQVCGPETCAAYNILKLTQQLYTLTPETRYIDFYERTLYNSILPSQAPGGGFVYYTSLRPGGYRRFSRPYDAFWCCVGTGMENHGKYGQMIYAHKGSSRLFVNLFIPSVLTWPEAGMTLHQSTVFPEEPRTALTLQLLKPRKMTLSLRVPGWTAPGGFAVRVNGRRVSTAAHPGSYADVTRLWKSGDQIDLSLPMRVTSETLPHSSGDTAFFDGPILLAAPLGTEGLIHADFYGGGNNSDVHNQLADKSLPLDKAPGFIGVSAGLAARLRPVPGKPLTFTAGGLTQPRDVTLLPFYKIFFQRYAIYWPVQTAAARLQALKTAQQEETDTIDHVRIGDTDSEAAHQMATDQSAVGRAVEPFLHWRDAKGFFSYVLKVLPDRQVSLRSVYWGGDTDRVFDILVDGRVIGTQHLTGSHPGGFLTIDYPIPSAVSLGKVFVTVRFVPKTGSTAGGLFDLRVRRDN